MEELQELLKYIELLESQSFVYWSEDAKNGYKTATGSIKANLKATLNLARRAKMPNRLNCKRFLFVSETSNDKVFMVTAIDCAHAHELVAKETGETVEHVRDYYRHLEASKIKRLNVGLGDKGGKE